MPRRTNFLVTVALFCSAGAHAQNPAEQRVPPGFSTDPAGTIKGAMVWDVVISTSIAGIGPVTKFLIAPPQKGAKAEWFFVKNDSSVKALERGAIIGLLMGALETREWSRGENGRNPYATVNIKYETRSDRKEIIAASLSSDPE